MPDAVVAFRVIARYGFARKWISWLRERQISIVIHLCEDAYLDEVLVSQKQGQVESRIRRVVYRKGFFVAPVMLAGSPLFYIAVPDQKRCGYGYRRLRRIACNARLCIGLVLRLIRKLTQAIRPPLALEVGYSKSVQ